MKIAASIKKRFHTGLARSFLCMIIGMFTLPSFVYAAEAMQTYDRQSIRYPSMNTGQIWAKIGGNSSPNPDMGAGKISTKVGGNSSPDLDAETGKASTKTGGDSSSNPGADTKQVSTKNEGNSSPNLNRESKILNNETSQGTEIKKRLKKKSSRKVRAQNNNGSQTVTVNNNPSRLKTDDKENQKTSVNKPVQPKKVLLADGKKSEIAKADQPVKNWHHKQELYDIDCGEKLARVVVTYYFNKREMLLKSSQTPDAEWYHIYPGSFEEQLYTEICNPHW
jgi:hypothetical protein